MWDQMRGECDGVDGTVDAVCLREREEQEKIEKPGGERKERKTSSLLEETLDVALVVEADVVIPGSGRQSRKGLNVSAQGVEEARTGRQSDVSDGQREAGRDSLSRGLVRERQGRLGHADGQVGEALLGVVVDLDLGLGRDIDAVGTVHLLGNGLNLLGDGSLKIVCEGKEETKKRSEIWDEKVDPI